MSQPRTATPPKAPLSTTHPKHVYHPDGRSAIAGKAPWSPEDNEAHEQALREKGFTLNSPVPVEDVPVVTLEEQLGAAKQSATEANQRFSELKDKAIAEVSRIEREWKQAQDLAEQRQVTIFDLHHENEGLARLVTELKSQVSDLSGQLAVLKAAAEPEPESAADPKPAKPAKK